MHDPLMTARLKNINAFLISSFLTYAGAAGAHEHTTIEKGTQAFLDAVNHGPPLQQLPPKRARAVVNALQASVKVEAPKVEVTTRTITVDKKPIDLTIVRPAGLTGPLPVVMFFHGGGWVLGDFQTYERLVRDLAVGSSATFVFVNYTLSPEAHYPVAINQAYAATRWVAEHGRELDVDSSRLATDFLRLVEAEKLSARAPHVRMIAPVASKQLQPI